ncbi:MAG: YcaO-related McrA-glycine thioamidation protein [Methanomicrobiales archaeon]|nr:YcaO-related McrA-glycine thioamidation protein [Methanomicrobiales archaeon]
MRLFPCKKGYRGETERAVPPSETLTTVEAKLPAAGITRVADITSLDRIGIPVFSSIRPTALNGAISVYNGKGATPTEAKVSAMMEGIERYSAEPGALPIIRGTFDTLTAEYDVVDPATLILPRNADPSAPFPWVEGFSVPDWTPVLLPAHAVFHPFMWEGPPLFRTNTNGLASGNTREEAVFHGLMEVVERDAWSLAEASRTTGNIVRVDTPGTGSDLLLKFAAAGVEVTVKDITSDLGIPTFAAVADDITLRDPSLLTIGMGTHTKAGIALVRALTEVAQSRLTQIHGAREDTTVAEFRRRIGYERTKRMNQYWFEGTGEISLSSIPSCESDDFLTDIEQTVRALNTAGFPRVLVVDLTRVEIGVPVVRVIVPGLEVFAMDGERIGKRCNDARNRRVPRPKPAS